jgi:uncharacterized protein YuzE
VSVVPVLSDHVRRQVARRGIDEAILRMVAEAPEQVVPVSARREIRQSRVPFAPHGKLGPCVRGPVPERGDRGDRISHEQDREILEDLMKVNYDTATDILTVVLRDAPVAESDEDKPGVILDYDKDGNLISLEILDASKRVTDTRKVDFQLAE